MSTELAAVLQREACLMLLMGGALAGPLLLLPLPGMQALPAMARSFLLMALAVALAGGLPEAARQAATVDRFPVLLLLVMTKGLLGALVAAMLTEMLVFGMAIIASQAGFSFASTIDPFSAADSSVLQTLGSTIAGLLCYSTGFDHLWFRAIAQSTAAALTTAAAPSLQSIDLLILLLRYCLEDALRLALPISLLLLAADIGLAMLGRFAERIQVMSLAFPAKILVTLLLLAFLAGSLGSAFERHLTRIAPAMKGASR
jgi:flagellar biosynthesis protein FliR